MSEPILDLEDVLYRIQGDKALLVELIDIFLSDTPQRLEEIKVLLAGADFVALADAAHSVKGSSGNIGAKQLMYSFKAMEEAGKQKDLEAFRKNFDKALGEFAIFKDHALTVKRQLSQ